MESRLKGKSALAKLGIVMDSVNFDGHPVVTHREDRLLDVEERPAALIVEFPQVAV